MRWNAFSAIEPAIDRTKKLLFPIRFGFWNKVGIVSLLSSYSGSSTLRGGGSGSGGNPATPIAGNNKTQQITGNAVREIGGAPTGIIAFLVLLVGAISLIFTYITSMFSYIFVDLLVKRDVKIGKSWRENTSNGRSLFGFKVIVGLLLLALYLLIFLPFIIEVFSEGFIQYFDSHSLLQILGDIWISLVIAGLFAIATGIVLSIGYDFGIPLSYQNKQGFWNSAKKTWSMAKEQVGESLLYWLTKVVISIVVSIIILMIILVLLVIGLIAGILLLLSAYLISKVLAITMIVIMVLALVYVVFLASVPLSVFTGYFSLICYEHFAKKKLLKR